ncbi:MAG: ABC transporter permease [Bryobacteraceae bacterium]|jgi:predicted permease
MTWWRRKGREWDLDREIRADLALEAEEQGENGLSSEAAYDAARRAFGNVTSVKEEVRFMWGWTLLETVFQELRYAGRTLGRNPGFATTAILTLALGIGASTAVFTVVDSVLLKPLAYHDAGRLVACWERVRSLKDDAVGPNPRHVEVWRQRATAFSGLTYLRHIAVGLTMGAEHPRQTSAVTAIPNFFDVLQVHALLGRTFVPGDGIQGHDDVAVLTYGLWQDLFHGDPGVIGATVRLGDVPRRVVGVLPADFHFPSGTVLRSFRRGGQTVSPAPDPAIFFPVALDLMQFTWSGNYGNWVTLGRLNPGVAVAQASTQLNTIQAQILADPAYRGDRRPGALGAWVQPMQEAVVGDSRTALWLLMGSVLGLMLIACLNLANAQLGRALARNREYAVRTALGAAKWRLAWNALAENLLLAAVGGATGILLAKAVLGLFLRDTPVGLPRLSEVQLNLSVLLFSVLLTCGASLLSGLLPALRLFTSHPHSSLQQSGSRSLGSRHGNRLRRWLIGLQVAGCTALLLVTGLFSKSLLHLLGQEKGFDTSQVAVAEVRLTQQTYGKDQSRVNFDDGVLANLRAIPGVQSAALMSAMPLDGESWIEPVQRMDMPNLETPLINLRWVGPGYFETTRQRLLAGRFFEERDRNLTNAVLSEGEAKALWGNDNPIGGKVQIEGRIFTVIGIVADSRNTSLKTPPARMAYVHYRDRPPFPTYFLIRAANAGALGAIMRQAIWKYDPDVTIARVKTLDAQLTDSLAPERFETLVLLSFGASALLLAMLGIYGVLSYSVVKRKQEIGVRMALGSTRARIYKLTFAEAGTPVFVGVITGLGASLLASRAIQSLLYETQAVDPLVILIVTSLFLLSAAAAAFLPARRAASVDPMQALRSE